MPANLVNLEAVTKSYGVRTLLHDVSLGVAAGERIGVVGRNGDGKTTLVSVLAGLEPPDAGRVTHTGGLRIGVVAQRDEPPVPSTARDHLFGVRAEHEWASDPAVRNVLGGLLGGFREPLLDARLDMLSGGERRRVALAAALVGEHGLLVLDEPTNHLDVAGIDWLARHLAARRSALVVVTHDRWLLDAVVERTWEVADGRVHDYDGGYSSYVLAKAERARIAAAGGTRRQNLLRKELAWLRRGPPARTSKPRFRVDAANALIADEPGPRDSVELVRFAAARLGKTVYELHDATVAAASDAPPVLDRLTWTIGPGDRIGLVGVNGSGKTSLLRVLAGDAKPIAGRLVRGKTVRAAYLSQSVAELDPSLRVLPAVEEVRRFVTIGKRDYSASALLDRFGFAGERQWTPVGELSGGERRRLQILRLLLGGVAGPAQDEPNVLLLDEPTNDLDIETLTALEDLLDGWAGTLLVVSHDRYFLQRVTDRIVALLGDGSLALLPGGVEEYLERRRPVAGSPVPDRRATLEAPPTPAAIRRTARKELARIERALDRVAVREAELHAALAEHASDYEKVAALDAELRTLLAERATLEYEWLTVAEILP